MQDEDEALDARRRTFLERAEVLERRAENSNDAALRESWKLIAVEYRRLAKNMPHADVFRRRRT